jgi:hypothetical protein
MVENIDNSNTRVTQKLRKFDYPVYSDNSNTWTNQL